MGVMTFSRHVVDLNVVIDVILNEQECDQYEISLLLRKLPRILEFNSIAKYYML